MTANQPIKRQKRRSAKNFWLTTMMLPVTVWLLVIRYLPALRDLTAIVTKTKTLPSTRVTIIILAAGAVLTIPLLPLRSLITAAYVDGLEKE